jgi:hypothetical protein
MDETGGQAKKKENDVSRELARLLQAECQQKFPAVQVDHLKKVLIGLTCGVRNKRPVPLLQSAEQDIVLSLRDNKAWPAYRVDESNFLNLRFTGGIPRGTITIPLVVFEVKYRAVNTHAVRLYSETARLVKAIFPFCSYYLVLIDIKGGKKAAADKIYMAAKHFDRVIYKPDYSTDQTIQADLTMELWELAKFHIKYLKKEPFFGLGDLLEEA